MVPQLVSELASESSNGIGISSVYLTKDLKPDTAISIIETIKSYKNSLHLSDDSDNIIDRGVIDICFFWC